MDVSWWAVALGALLGAPSRYLLSTAVESRFGGPGSAGTLTVNLLGSAGAGLLAGAAVGGGVDPLLVSLLGVGFLGAFTTASTFAYEVVELGTSGRLRAAWLTVAASAVLGPGLALACFALARGL